MNGLVDYSGDESDNDSDTQDGNVSRMPASAHSDMPHGTLVKKLPKPKTATKSAHAGLVTSDELDTLVRRHDWEIQNMHETLNRVTTNVSCMKVKEAPTRPLVHKKSVGPVKIVLPDMPADDSDESDEEASARRRRTKARGLFNAAQPTTIKLFSMLPPPQSAPPPVNNNKKTLTMFVPDSVKARVAVKRKLDDDDKKDEDEQPPSRKHSHDFFGFEKRPDEIIPDMSGLAERAPRPINWASVAESEQGTSGDDLLHPSQMYNLANEQVAAAYERRESDQGPSFITDERALALVNRFEGVTAGLMPAGSHDLQFRTVSAQAVMDKIQVRANLLKPLSKPVPPQISEKEKDLAKPESFARRKHQITYLAFLAKQQEDKLKEDSSKQHLTKKQTYAKYGW